MDPNNPTEGIELGSRVAEADVLVHSMRKSVSSMFIEDVQKGKTMV